MIKKTVSTGGTAKVNILEKLGKEILFIDGAMGSMMQAMGALESF